MTRIAYSSTAAVLLALTFSHAAVEAQSRVQYGRITNVTATQVNSGSSQTVGTLVGGGIGLASGSGQSGSNRALRTVGGAAAGRGIGGMAGRTQAFEYTVLVGGTTTTRIVSDQAGKRVGDCVAVEQGQFSNIRLVDDARCSPPPARTTTPAPHPARAPAQPVVPVTVTPAAIESASACDQAKEMLLSAETDEAFTLGERRMRLLCGE